MIKFLKWSAYTLVALSAILIICSLVGRCCHHRHSSEKFQKEMVCAKDGEKACKDSANVDSTKCMPHKACCQKMAESDSMKCPHAKACCKMNEMQPMAHRMHGEMHFINLIELSKALLLLAIALLIIVKTCCSCCCKEKSCENGECKKES